MRIKIIAGLMFCLTSALFTSEVMRAGATGPDSLEPFRSASSPNGKSGNAYVERGARKEAMENFDEAIADYSEAIRIEPKSAEAHAYRTLAYLALGSFNKAIADFDVVLRENPEAIRAYLNRGHAHADVNAALSDYDNAIRYATNTASGNVTEGEAYYAKGDYANAASRFTKAKQMSPRDDDVLNSVAWFQATCPDKSFRNGGEALRDSTKACELTKWNDAHCIDTLAAAHAEGGNFDQAIQYQRQALGMKPITPDVRKQMKKHLYLYQAHKPFRNEPRLRGSAVDLRSAIKHGAWA